MHTTRMQLMIALLLLGVVFGGQFFLPFAQPVSQLRIETGNAQSEVANPGSVYLPFVFLKSPLLTRFGIEMAHVTEVGGLSKVVESGANWIRLNGVQWGEIEPVRYSPPVYNWDALSGLEQELQTAAEQGFRVILVVRDTPSWAQLVAGSSCGPIKPEYYTAFGEFLAALVGRLGKFPYEVDYWEIWNEPDVSINTTNTTYGCWGDLNDEAYFGGDHYGAMLKTVYPYIKQADSTAQVLVGGLLLYCNPTALFQCEKDDDSHKFLGGMLAAGAGPYFDGISFHAYDSFFYVGGAIGMYGNTNWNTLWNNNGPVIAAKAEFIRSVLQFYLVPDKYLINTESALLCGKATDPPGQFPCETASNSAFELTKAYYVPQAYAAAIAADLRANVWFNLAGWRNSGLIYHNKTGRPAFYAYKFAREELRDAAYVGRITESDIGAITGVVGHKFRQGGKIIWLIWSLDGADHVVTLSQAPLAVYDVDGTPIVISDNSLTVTIQPYYVEFPN